MSSKFINIACGETYVDGWCNLDYLPISPSVTRANLLMPLEFENDYAELIYCSHFLEHVPRDKVSQFMSECFRVAKPGARIRLVLPDLEILCRTYLQFRSSGEHEKADFLIMEIIDQCVRVKPGGELGDFLNEINITRNVKGEIADFVNIQTGYLFEGIEQQYMQRQKRFNNFWTLSRIEKVYCKIITMLLPKAFRDQNISFASVGERHTWLYDFYSIERLLLGVGFEDVRKMSASRSDIPDFPFLELDMLPNGRPRKGMESMYVEAVKP